MNIAVVGTGYVGLVTGTCFAEMGNHVTCVDIDANKVEKMRNSIIPIYEPHLDVLFERNIKQGRLQFTTNLEEAVKDATIIFLALPTPPGEDGSADLSYVLGVSAQLGRLIRDYKIVINKSTVPVGTAEKVREAIAKTCTVHFDVISNPEFLREGYAVDDFMKPDRVVIGTRSEVAKKVMSDLYAPFVRQGNPIYFMDERSAELTKYAANAFLATKITFMNEVSNLCEKVGANVDAIRIGIGSDSRIGKRFLFAGIGYGGSCFPKDVQALYRTSQDYNYDFKILSSVMEVNETHSISAFDPEAMENVKRTIGEVIHYANDPYEAAQGADAILIATEWALFRTPDFDKLKESMKEKVIFDGRNLYDLQRMAELGFYYNSMGRETVSPQIPAFS
ncbi:MAG: UDP-glucose/GDP-mannose dehydrogenase family protein [Bacteroidetes bacterium]|nr:UDP-glucose/GDP-mannose dehydrogenase family protein [Bacteroidota bacterium]